MSSALPKYNLGTMCGAGQGIVQDNQEAIRLYGLAAAQGYSSAYYSLGYVTETASVYLPTHLRRLSGTSWLACRTTATFTTKPGGPDASDNNASRCSAACRW